MYIARGEGELRGCSKPKMRNEPLQYVLILLQGHEVLGTLGAGGQVGYADFIHQVGYGYITNYGESFQFNDDPKVIEYQTLFYECLEQYLK